MTQEICDSPAPGGGVSSDTILSGHVAAMYTQRDAADHGDLHHLEKLTEPAAPLPAHTIQLTDCLLQMCTGHGHINV